jgi:hypothetical protein
MNEYIFEYNSSINNLDISVAGSFNNWNKIKMNWNKNKKMYYYKIFLQDGFWEYKYIINNQWIYDENYPIIITKEGYINNFLIIMLRENQTNRCEEYKTIWHVL